MVWILLFRNMSYEEEQARLQRLIEGIDPYVAEYDDDDDDEEVDYIETFDNNTDADQEFEDELEAQKTISWPSISSGNHDASNYTARSTDKLEIEALLGLLCLAGVRKSNQLNAGDLWKRNAMSIELFRLTMSLQN
ncbi:hypothetical protein QE152_g11024 [Popillia japonica]|uniref:PiggyBac transposable element-derived protein domain-containing protein n=1 Tax=Popillia japonica TaxID=7064 RepID=A0AAW1LTA3_POPJA